METSDPVRLRELVVRAAIPLLGAFDTLTTARIADAAGVEEANLLAVFADKDAVMQACVVTISTEMAAILDAGREMAALAAIRLDQPLRARLVDALGVFDGYHRRVGAETAAYERAMTGGLPAPEAPDQRSPAEVAADEPGESAVFADGGRGTVDASRSAGRQDLRFMPDQPEVQQAVVRLLEPDRPYLRLPVDVLAAAFLALARAGTSIRKEVQSPLRPEHVVDLFLHGATTG